MEADDPQEEAVQEKTGELNVAAPGSQEKDVAEGAEPADEVVPHDDAPQEDGNADSKLSEMDAEVVENAFNDAKKPAVFEAEVLEASADEDASATDEVGYGLRSVHGSSNGSTTSRIDDAFVMVPGGGGKNDLASQLASKGFTGRCAGR